MKVLMAAAIFGISFGNYGCSNEAKFAGMPMAAEELPVASPGATLQTAADANAEVETPTVVNPPAVVVNAPAVVNPPLVNNPPAVVNPPAVIPPTAVNPPVAAPSNWVDVTKVGPNLTLQDQLTGLSWSNMRPNATWQGASDHCGTLNYNGVSGWRLPTQTELMNAYAHGIKIAARANWMTLANIQRNFWSASSYSDDTNYAWLLYFENGYTHYSNKYSPFGVVCVRSAADANPSVMTTTGATITTTTGTTTVATWVNVTTVGPNLTLQDPLTRLSWSNRRPDATWQGAIDHCSALTYNGVSGWRLPTDKELLNAYDHGIISAARSNWMTFADMQTYFWSASSTSLTYLAWFVYLGNGGLDATNKGLSNSVVCVR